MYIGIIIVALAGLVLWSFIVFKTDRPRARSWADTAIATVLSVVLGLGAGFWVYEVQTEQSDERQRNDFRTLLAAELSDTRRILSTKERATFLLPDGSKVDLLLTTIQPLIVEKAATSGLFSSHETENLLHLARKIRMFQVSTQLALNLIAGRSGKANLAFASESIESGRRGILKAIEEFANQQKLDLTSEYVVEDPSFC